MVNLIIFLLRHKLHTITYPDDPNHPISRYSPPCVAVPHVVTGLVCATKSRGDDLSLSRFFQCWTLFLSDHWAWQKQIAKLSTALPRDPSAEEPRSASNDMSRLQENPANSWSLEVITAQPTAWLHSQTPRPEPTREDVSKFITLKKPLWDRGSSTVVKQVRPILHPIIGSVWDWQPYFPSSILLMLPRGISNLWVFWDACGLLETPMLSDSWFSLAQPSCKYWGSQFAHERFWDSYSFSIWLSKKHLLV